ncbi:MAG: lysophospholipid acyltransferase family protein [Bacillota bacterium]
MNYTRKTSKICNMLKMRLIPGVLSFLLRTSNWLIRLRVFGEDNIDKIKDKPVIYSFWHGKMWVPIYFYRGEGLVALASGSEDGEYLSRILKNFGWQVVRGSSTRGGSRSLLKLYRRLKKGDRGVITPDGPTGPRYKVKPGVVYLQEKSGGFIIPLGVAAERKFEADSWDRFIIPLPGSKTVLQIGSPLQLSPDKSVEDRCQILEEKMKEVESKAEANLSHW